MSVEKQTLSIPTVDPQKNYKLGHLNHIITRVYEAFTEEAPNQVGKLRKYDLVARNVNECLLLIEYRARQSERMETFTKKIKKIMKKI